MRLAPALGTCWLATVAVLVGCSTWTAVPKAARVLSAKAPSVAAETAETRIADSVRAGLRDGRVRVPHIDESDIRRKVDDGTDKPASTKLAEIADGMAEMQAEWDARRAELTSISQKSPVWSDSEFQTAKTKSRDILVTDAMIAVERKYAPKYMNCRIRIRLLESYLDDAHGAARDSLLRKLDQARTDLAAIEAARAKELAHTQVSPAVAKDDEERDSSKQNTGRVSDAAVGEGLDANDSASNRKAGGGAD